MAKRANENEKDFDTTVYPEKPTLDELVRKAQEITGLSQVEVIQTISQIVPNLLLDPNKPLEDTNQVKLRDLLITYNKNYPVDPDNSSIITLISDNASMEHKIQTLCGAEELSKVLGALHHSDDVEDMDMQFAGLLCLGEMIMPARRCRSYLIRVSLVSGDTLGILEVMNAPDSQLIRFLPMSKEECDTLVSAVSVLEGVSVQESTISSLNLSEEDFLKEALVSSPCHKILHFGCGARLFRAVEKPDGVEVEYDINPLSDIEENQVQVCSVTFVRVGPDKFDLAQPVTWVIPDSKMGNGICTYAAGKSCTESGTAVRITFDPYVSYLESIAQEVAGKVTVVTTKVDPDMWGGKLTGPDELLTAAQLRVKEKSRDHEGGSYESD